jgi:hypothetical protein
MKIRARLIIASLLMLSALASHAHPFHGNVTPITKEDAGLLGERVVSLMVQGSKLPGSWRGRTPADISTRDTAQGAVWVVRYENPDEADVAKRTIYLFFDEYGNYLGGNYSGKM